MPILFVNNYVSDYSYFPQTHPIVKEAVDLVCLFVCNKCGSVPTYCMGRAKRVSGVDFCPEGAEGLVYKKGINMDKF